MEEYKKEMLMVSAILFKNNVPVEEAKPIGAFIEKLIKENQQLKEQLERCEKARKESMRLLGEYRHYTLPTEEQNRENEDIVDKAYNNLILKQDIDKGEMKDE